MPGAPPKKGRHKILVVDDDENTLALAWRILRKEAQVETVSQAEEALKRLESSWFDLVITDLRMPGMDGLTLLERVKALSPTLPCIMLTGHGSAEAAIQAMRIGAWAYLEKPVDNAQLRLVVKRALGPNRGRR